jgi:TorA maturation chaperone TorD
MNAFEIVFCVRVELTSMERGLCVAKTALILIILVVANGLAETFGVNAALGQAAARTDEVRAGREFFDLFTGLGQGELLPYASHYLAGSLYGRPLARLREAFQRLGIETKTGHSESEDHVAILCEIMAGLISGDIAGPAGSDRAFFEEHLASWIGCFFADLERASSADFYARVGSLGRIFVGIEAEAFALAA